MKAKTLSRKTKVLVSLFLALVIVGTTLGICFSAGAFAWSSENVFELYNAENNTWSRAAFDAMAKKIWLSNGYATGIDDLVNRFPKDATVKNALNLLFQDASHDGSDFLDNDDGSLEWTVKLGDIEWMPVALSRDANDNLILTLWQATSTNMSAWNLSYTSDPDLHYPRSNMYSTSYIRTEGLNNSGTYYTGYGADGDEIDPEFTEHTYVQSTGHPYALYTTGALSSYIAAPKDVAYQTSRALYVNDYANTTEGYADAQGSFELYQSWANDNLWLPTRYEVLTLWQSTVNQKTNNVGSWLRDSATTTTNSGTAKADRLYRSGTVAQDFVDDATGNAIRPAMHFNLTRAAQKVSLTEGYSKTETTEEDFTLFQQAWKECVSHAYFDVGETVSAPSGTRVVTSAEVNANKAYDMTASLGATLAAQIATVAEISYNASDNSITFKMMKDWGARIYDIDENGKAVDNKDVACFGGSFHNFDEYFCGGALHVPYGTRVTIDLNGHILNRNLYNFSTAYNSTDYRYEVKILETQTTTFSTYQCVQGSVIVCPGIMFIDDTSAEDEMVGIDENGLKGCGRICGGLNSTPDTNNMLVDRTLTNGTRISYGMDGMSGFPDPRSNVCYPNNAGGIAVMGTMYWRKGAVCYNMSKARGAGIMLQGMHSEGIITTGGILAFNAQCPGGKGFAALWVGSGFKNGANYTEVSIYDLTVAYNNLPATNYGILHTSGASFDTRMYIYNAHVYNNVAGNGIIEANEGDAVLHGRIKVYGGYYHDNTVTYDGGCFKTYNWGEIEVHGGTFENCVSNRNGGVVAADANTKITITAGTFRNCSSAYNGGAIFLGANATCNISGGVFENCSSTNGGGVYMASGTLNLTGGTITNCEAKKLYTYNYTYKNASGTTVSAVAESNEKLAFPVGAKIMSVNQNEDGKYVYTYTYNGNSYTLTSQARFNKEFDLGIVTSGGVETARSGATITQGATYKPNTGIGGGAYLAGGTMNLAGITFANNRAYEYPGFYSATTANVAGNTTITGNVNNDGVEENIYLATPGASITVTGLLTSHIGMTKSFTESTKNYQLTENPSLAGKTYLMKVEGEYDNYVKLTVDRGDGKTWYAYEDLTVTQTTAIEHDRMRVIVAQPGVLQENIDGTVYYIYKDTNSSNRTVYYNGTHFGLFDTYGNYWGYRQTADNRIIANVLYKYNPYSATYQDGVWTSGKTVFVVHSGKVYNVGGKQRVIFWKYNDLELDEDGNYTKQYGYINNDVFVPVASLNETVLATATASIITSIYPTTKPAYLVEQKYTLTMDDALAFQCDTDRARYTFTVINGSMYLEPRPKHVHSWENKIQAPSCDECGYNIWVCTGCQEIYDKDDPDHKGTENGKACVNAVYTAATGHNYIWSDAQGCFVCQNNTKDNGHKYLYVEWSIIPDQMFQGKAFEPEVSWRLYYNVNGRERVYWDTYEDGHNNFTGYINSGAQVSVSYENNMHAGTATVKLSFNLTLFDRQIYIKPYGTGAGVAIATEQEYLAEGTAGRRTLGWQFNHPVQGVAKTTFRIRQNTTSVQINLPTAPDQGWFVTDKDAFFSRFAWYAYVDEDMTKIVAQTGSTTHGNLQWSMDGKTWSAENPDLIAGTNNYRWRFVPANTKDLTAAQGYITLTVRQFELNRIVATFDGDSAVLTDYQGWSKIFDRFDFEGEFITNYNAQGNPITVWQTIERDDEGLSCKLVDALSGEKYSVLRSGDNFQFEFTYTFNGITKTYLTPYSLPIISKTVTNIYMSWKNGSQPSLYDSMTSLDDLREHLVVTDNYGDPVESYVISCPDWIYVANANRNALKKGTHQITLSYGSATPVSFTISVTANTPSSLRVTWNQKSEATTATATTDLDKYGTLKVEAIYLDGTETVLPMQKDGQVGYTFQQTTIPKVGSNNITIRYTEVNLVSGGSKTVTARITVQATEYKVSEVYYEMKPGEVIVIEDGEDSIPADAIKDKIIVKVLLSDGITVEEVVPMSGTANTGVVYFGVDEPVYITDDGCAQFGITIYRNGSVVTQTVGLEPIGNVVVTAITVDPVSGAAISELMTPEYVRDNLMVVTAIRNIGEPIVVWDPTDPEHNSDAAREKISVWLASSQNGKFIANQTNNIYVSYTPSEEDDAINYTWQMPVSAVTLDEISVTVKNDAQVTLDNGKIAVKEDLVFTSSSLDDIKQYITVKGFNAANPQGFEIQNYTVSGSLANYGLYQFTVTATITGNGGTPVDVSSEVYVNVTRVVLDHIEAILDQGTTYVYTNTTTAELRNIISVTAFYNDGSQTAISSGYSIEIYSDLQCTTPSSLQLGQDNYLKIKYIGKTCNIGIPVEVVPGFFVELGYNVVQGNRVVYETSSQQKVANTALQVYALLSDGTTRDLTYDPVSNGANYYKLTGTFADGGYMTIVSNGATLDIDRSLITFTPTVVTALQVKAPDGSDIDSKNIRFNENFELDMLKRNLYVEATYNDPEMVGWFHIEDESKYTLVRTEVTEPSTNKTCVEVHADSVVAEIWIEFYINPIKEILQVESLQEGTLYASVSLDTLRSLTKVHVKYWNGDQGELTQLTFGFFDLTGTINDDGSYELLLSVNAAEDVVIENGEIKQMTQTVLKRTFKNTDPEDTRLFNLTPIQPETIRVTCTQTEDDFVYSGAEITEVLQYFKVEVSYNDNPTVFQEIEYGEYSASGNFIVVGNNVKNDCPVTFSFTHNGKTVTATGTFRLSPAVVDEITMEVTDILPTVYYAWVFTDGVAHPENLVNYLNQEGKQDISMSAHYTDNTVDVLTDGDYTYEQFKNTDGTSLTAAQIAALKENGGDVTVVVKYDKFSKEFTLHLTAARPDHLEAVVNVPDGTTMFTSTSLTDVRGWMTITMHYTDGVTTEVLTGNQRQTVSVLEHNGTAMAMGGNVDLLLTYYSNKGIVTGIVTVTPEFPTLEGLDVTVKTSGSEQLHKLYSFSSEDSVKAALTVNANFSDSPYADIELDPSDYTITYNFAGLADANATVTVTYEVRGVTKTKTVSVYVSEAVITAIEADTSALDAATIYTSGSLDDIRDLIIINACVDAGEGETEVAGVTTDYVLTIGGLTSDNVTLEEGDCTVLVTYTPNTAITTTLTLHVTEVALYNRKVVLQQEGYTIYDDYQLEEIVEDLKARIVMNETWNDGLTRPGVYEFVITSIQSIAGSRNKVRVNYTHEKAGTLNPVARNAEITLTLTATEMTGISVKTAENYKLYTSNFGSQLTEKCAAATVLSLVYNSGKTAEESWSNYVGQYAFTANKSAWEAGGEVTVNVTLTIDSKTYTTSLKVNVTSVALETISATWVQNTGADGIIYASATAAKVLDAGELTVTGINNDGTAYSGAISVTADNLSFDFSTGAEVTVTLSNGLTCKFTPTVTPVTLTSLSATLVPDVTVYSSSNIADVASYIAVTASYNDGSTKVLGYNANGTDGYKVTAGDLTLTSEQTSKTASITVAYKDVSVNVEKSATIENVTVNADTLESISATYAQGTEKVYAYKGVETVSGSAKLNVRAQFTQQGEVLVATGFIVSYDGEIPDANGTIQLTVSYTYNGVTKTDTINVQITKKQVIGIEVEWTSMNREIFSTTTPAQLVSNTAGNNLQKGELAIYKTFNDGSDRELVANPVFGTDYTVTCDLAASTTATVTYNLGEEQFTDTFEVTQSITAAKITGITAEWNEQGQATDLYLNSLDIVTLQGLLKVVGSFNDDNTAARDLTSAEYTVEYTANVVGNTTFTIKVNSSSVISSSTSSVTVNKVVKHRVTTADLLPLEYKVGEEWVAVPEVGIIEGKSVELRLPFTAKDETSSTKYIDVDKTSVENANWATGTYTLAVTGLQDSSDGDLYKLPEGENALTATLKLSPRTVVGNPVISYVKFDGATIYTSTLLDELYKDVDSVSAKGKIVWTVNYNNGDVDVTEYSNGKKVVYNNGVKNEADSGDVATYPFTLGGSLTSGTSSGTASISVSFTGADNTTQVQLISVSGVVVPAIKTITAEVTGTLAYGANENDIRTALVITAATFEDDGHQQPYTLALSNTAALKYYTDANKENLVAGVPVNAGDYYVDVDISAIEGYSHLASVMAPFTFRQLQLTSANIAAVADMVYSGADLKPKPEVNFDGVLTEGVDFEYSYANNRNAGTASISVTGKGNYYGTGTINFTITKKVVAIPTLDSVAYTGSHLQPSLDATYSSVYATTEDSVQKILGIPAADFEAHKTEESYYGEMSASGTYYLKLHLNDTTNYAWEGTNDSDIFVPFTITSSVAEFSDENFTVTGWTYGATPVAPTGATAVMHGTTDSVDVQYVYAPANGREAFAIANSEYSTTVPTQAGTYFVKAYIPANAGEYPAVYSSATKQLVIAKVQLKVTVNTPAAIFYGDAVPSYSVTYSGFVSGETRSVLTGTLAYSGYTVGDDAGSYTISASGYEEVNYEITYVSATLVVNKVTLTPSAVVDTKVYNGNTVASGTISLSGAVRDEVPTATGAFVWASANAGEKTYSVSGIALDEVWNTNYALSTNSLSNVSNEGVAITPRSATVVWTTTGLTFDAEKSVYTATYTGSELTKPTATIQGITADGTLNVSVNMNNIRFQNADSYTFTATSALNSDDSVNGNYTLENTTLQVVIGKQTVAKPVIASKNYTGATLTSGLVDTALYKVVEDEGGIDAGSYDVKLALVDSNNYKWDGEEDGVEEITLQFLISQVTNSFTSEAISASGWTYGGMPVAPSGATATLGTVQYVYAPVADKDDLSAYSATVPVNAGTYAVRAFVPAGTTADGSYGAIYSATAVEITIAKAALSVTIDQPEAINYYDAVPAFTLSYSGFVNGDDAAKLGIVPVFSGYSVGDNAGEYVISVADITLDNYDVTVDATPVKLTVNKVTLTPVASISGKTYDNNKTATGTITLQGAVNDEQPVATATFEWSAVAAGTNKFNVTDIALGSTDDLNWNTNYVLSTTSLTDQTSETASIKAKQVTVNWNVAESYTYTGLVQQMPSATITNINGQPTNVTVTISQPTGVQFLNAGSYTFLATYANANYELTDNTRNVTIQKAKLTITVEGKTVEYGQELPELTYTVEGLVNGEVAANVITGFELSCPNYTTTTAVGQSATINNTEPSATNYDITVVNNAVVKVVAMHNSFVDGGAFEFEGATFEDGAWTTVYGTTVTISGFSAENGTVKYVFATVENAPDTAYSEATPKAVGTYYVKAYVPATNAYTAIYSEAVAKLVITKATLTVTVVIPDGAESIEYGSYMTTGVSASFEGFKYDDAESSLGGAITFAGYTRGNTVGDYTITASGLTSDNYEFDYVAATLHVTPRTLTPTAAVNGKIYDGTTSATGTITLSGIYNNEAVSATATFTWNAAKATTTAFGVSDITLTGAANVISNYVLSVTSLSDCTTAGQSISAKSVEVVWNLADSYIYSGSALEHPTASIVGVGEDGTINLTVTLDGDFINVGSYTFTATLPSDNDADVNYVLTGATKTIAIEQLTVTPPEIAAVPFDGQSHVADIDVTDKPYTVTTNNGGTAGGQYPVVLTLTSANYKWEEDAGEISSDGLSITLTFVISTVTVTFTSEEFGFEGKEFTTAGDVKTYTYTYGDTLATISGATATAVDDDGTSGYEGGNPTVVYRFATSLNGTYSSTAPKAAGTYYVKAYVPSTNYYGSKLSTNYIVLVIAKKTLSVTIDTPAAIIYGDDAPTFSATYSGFVYDENESVLGGNLVLTSEYAKGSAVGSYPISATNNLTSDNYTITLDSTPVALVVNKAVITDATAINATIQDKAYDGTTAATGTVTVTGVNGEVLPATATWAWTNAQAGTVTFTVTDIALDSSVTDNYSLSASLSDVQTTSGNGIGQLTITNIDWVAADSYTYQGTAITLPTASFQGVAGDGKIDLTVTSTNAANNAPAEFKDAMTYKLIASTSNTNYKLDSSAATIERTISKAELRLTIKDVFVFRNTSINDVKAQLDFTVSGLLGSDQSLDVRDIMDGFELSVDSTTYNPNAVNGSKFPVLYTTPAASNYTVVVTNGTTTMNGSRFVSTANVTLISKVVTISGTPSVDVTSWTYGDSVTLNATGCTATIADATNEASPFTGEILYAYSETLNGTYTVGTPVNAGHYFIKAYVPKNDDIGYGDAYSENYLEVDISKAVLNVAPGIPEGSHYYGEPVAYFPDITGFKNGDTAAVITNATPVYTGYVVGNTIGTYTISVTGYSEIANYTFTYSTSELTIEAKPITISNILANGKVYDGKDTVTLDLTSVVFSGLYGSETLGIEVSGKFADVNAGENKAVILTDLKLTGEESVLANYVLAPDGNQTEAYATISKVELTVKVSNKQVVVGTQPENINFRTSIDETALIKNEKLEDILNGTLVFACDYTASAVLDDTFTITASGYEADNYSFKYLPGTLKVVSEIKGFELTSDAKVYFAKQVGNKLVEVDAADIDWDNDTIYLHGLTNYKLGQTLAQIKAMFDNGSEITAVNNKGAALTDAKKVGTGTVLSIDSFTVTIVLPGDLTGDGSINALDRNSLQKYMNDSNLFAEQSFAVRAAADIDGNGRLNALDRNKLQQQLNKKTMYPV